jgi:uncharacterized membrane protein
MAVHASELGGATPALLALHIAAGGIAALSGTAALSFAKGAPAHRAVGNAFFLSMLTMSASAAYLAALTQDMNFFVALFTFYLVATAWAAVERKEGSVGRFEVGAFLFALCLAVVEAYFGLQAAKSATGRFMNTSAQSYFFIASLATLAAALDLKVIMFGGVSGAARIARHLWRMCFAFFIALLSFMIQGLRAVLPPSMPEAKYVFVLALLPLAAMTYWLIRVRLTNWWTNAPAIRRDHAREGDVI